MRKSQMDSTPSARDGAATFRARSKPRLAIVSDQPLTRFGARLLFESGGAFQVSMELDCSPASLTSLDGRRPDLIVVEIAQPIRRTLAWLRRLRATDNGVRILAVAAQPEWLLGVRALRAGANSFIRKTEDAAELRLAAQLTSQGRGYVGNTALNQLMDVPRSGQAGSPFAQLSDCELDVFFYVLDGVSVSQIKERLNITDKAVRNYKSRVTRKLNLSSELSFSEFAVDQGLIAA